MTYSLAAKIAAHTALRDLIEDATPALVRLRSSTDVVLAEIELQAGVVNSGTGRLTFTQDAPAMVGAGGTAVTAQVCDNAGTVHITLPVVEGSNPVSNKCVISQRTLLVGAEVSLISLAIG